MKKIFSPMALAILFLASLAAPAVAQHYRPHSHHYYHRSNYSRAMRGLDAIETAADYALLGTMLSKIDDYSGLRFGYNSASLKCSDAASTDNIPAFNAGIVFGWYLGRSPFSIEPGLFYAMKGGKVYESNGLDRLVGRDMTKYTMHSFETPVVLKAHLPMAPHVSLQPFAGAFMSFGFAGTTTYSDGDKYDTFDDNVLDDFDAGFRFGSGLAIGNAYFEAAYDLGLVNLCNTYTFGYNPSLRSRTWSFNIGFNF